MGAINSVLLAIDPGASSGFAVFAGGQLTQGIGLTPDDVFSLYPDLVVIENPQIYPRSPVPPNDIVTLARIAGRYQERYKLASQRRLVTPHEWKGSIPKKVMTNRIKAALTPTEQKTLGRFLDNHNVLDAVGLGKWALKQPWAKA